MAKEEKGPVLKGAEVLKAGEPAEGDLALINRQALRELSAEEVYTFRLAACGNQIDRDIERFTDTSLDDMARLYVGKTVISDHKWSSGGQIARVYAAAVEEQAGGVKRLVLSCYMPRTEETKAVIDAIDAGILREVSVAVAVRKYTCSVCGKDYMGPGCPHLRGQKYGDAVCHVELDGVSDVYEVSFVAVPAQPEAGVIKRYGTKENAAGEDPEAEKESTLRAARARLELEKLRF